MLVIEMEFPGGRYHATPWDKQVNEGAVEWPPSPWRLLRAIIATWYSKGEGVEFDLLRSTIEKITSNPEFHLPPATMASTCHFMPLYRSPIDEKTAKIYDAFAHVGNGRLKLIWRDVTLESREKETLNTLLSRMGYLGRAESWTEAKIIESDEPMINSRPSTGDPTFNGGRVPTMCCLTPSDFLAWRERTMATLMEKKADEKKAKAEGSGKVFKGLTAKEKKEMEDSVPSSLFDALLVDTSEMRAAGWPRPPGSVWIDYDLPEDAFLIRPLKKAVGTSLPTVARYKVRAKVPWMIFDAVTLGEMVHKKLVRLSDGSRTFTGCDESGQPLRGDHVIILSHGISSQIKGMRITDLTVYNKDGFTSEDVAALRSLNCIDPWGCGGKGRRDENHGRSDGQTRTKRGNDVENEVILVGIGGTEMFGSEEGIIGRSSIWTSLTPFVPTRCPKYTRAGEPKIDENGQHIGSAEHELRRLLGAEGYPEVIRITPIPRALVGGSSRSWLSFRRRRSSDEREPLNEAGFGFEIEFAHPIEGPLAMGYGRNFGLGLFRPGR